MIVDILRMFYRNGSYTLSDLNEFVKAGRITEDNLEYITSDDVSKETEILDSVEEEVEF